MTQTPHPPANGGKEPNAVAASIAHWSQLGNFVIPFCGLIGPLVLMLTTGKEDRFVYENAKEGLNFFIFTFIMTLIGVVLTLVLIGFLILAVLFIFVIITSLIGAIQTIGASPGSPPYRYPMIFRVLPASM